MSNELFSDQKLHTEKRTTIRVKLVSMFILTSAVVLVVNLFVYINLNKMIDRIDQIYSSNININDLSNSLSDIQTNMGDYLETKSSDSLEDYFKAYQDYNNTLQTFNDTIADNEVTMMEKTVKNLSESYFEITNATIQAKRGRNIEGYVKGFEQSEKLYAYLNNLIYSLNNERFQTNSENYVQLLSSMKYSEVLCLSILAVVALTNVILTILLTRSITTPLYNLSKQADEISKGNLNVELLRVESSDEVGVVTAAFNQMVTNLKEYIVQLRNSMEKERELKENELRMDANLKEAQLMYLQAQINPHFLFNTLNAGAQLAMLEGADRTNQYIQRMADFFRYNVQNNNENVTIAQELELIDNYIYILNVRFAGDIHYEKDIDESLLNITIPSMVIQPLVENSVNYGIRNIDWEGKIGIFLYKEDDKAILCVEDNGVGVSKEMLDEINSCEVKQSTDYSDSNGVGLNNVITRLNLFYKRKDIFEMVSDGENMGTRTYIRIPLSDVNE